MKYILIFSAVLLFNGCKDEENSSFQVKGKVANPSSNTIYLEEASLTSNYPIIVDSSTISKNGEFELNTKATEENLYVLRLGQQINPVATVINDRSSVVVNIDQANATAPYTVKNSPASEKLTSYLQNANTKLSEIYNLSIQTDSLQTTGADNRLVQEVLNKRSSLATNFRNSVLELINESKSPSLTIFVIGSYQSYASNQALGLQGFTQDEMVDLLNKASVKFPNHNGLASIKMNITGQSSANEASSLMNKPAPQFTLNDVNGNPVSLSSFKGKYVLVDFWASWCQPCRVENPNVVEAYNQFKDKNFTILGVSLDKSKEPWLKAIKDDKLSWTHVSDLKYWESMVVPLYGINSIPYNVLLDPSGVVIAENLRGEELASTLSEKIK